jgi:hypothetical protein
MSDANATNGPEGSDEQPAGEDAPDNPTDGERPTDPMRAGLAAEFESVAAALRAGEATVYGYEIRDEPAPAHESGAVSFPGGWLEFRFEER